MKTYRDEDRVSRLAFFLQPFAQATDSNTASFADGGIGIIQSTLDDWPNLAHERSHVFTAAFHCNTKSKHRTSAIAGIRRRTVLLDQLAQCRENLSRGQIRSQAIDDAKSGLHGIDQCMCDTTVN